MSWGLIDPTNSCLYSIGTTAGFSYLMAFAVILTAAGCTYMLIYPQIKKESDTD